MAKQSALLVGGIPALVILVMQGLLGVAPADAGGCEKWKSEFLGAGATVTSYINAHRKYFNQKMTDVEFKTQTDTWLDKLALLEVKVKAVDSCPHPENKFEKRKDLLLKTLAVVMPLMKSGEEVAPQIRQRLDLHEKE
ncbi:MAG: hypothetical protein KF751_18745 [Nitrospira sp.]|nr:hypothetical protein [Nitrospira sp.]